MKFLEAEWRHLVMLNYEIDPSVLKPYLPAGTELDFFERRTYLSLVGFMFLDTRVLHIPIPFHRNFEEVNLRFYVRYLGEEGWRRGVVFIKEIVPRRAIAAVARAFYNEPYIAMPMRHQIQPQKDSLEVQYEWRHKGLWNSLYATALPESQAMIPGSEEEFIAEHYWGYTAQRDGSTVEYQVVHPKWMVHKVTSMGTNCDFELLYGSEFKKWLEQSPASCFLAAGSEIAVSAASKLRSIRIPDVAR